MIHAQIQRTTGGSGSGKSYCRGVMFVLHEWLKEYSGTLWTNMPIKVEEMADYAAEHNIKDGAEYLDYEKRLRPLPHEVKEAWKDAKSGPWEFFKDVSVEEWEEKYGDAINPLWAGSHFPDSVEVYVNKAGDEVAGINLDGDYFQIDEAHNYIGTFVSGFGLTRKEHANFVKGWQAFLAEGRHRGLCSIEFITQHPKKLHKIVEMESGARIHLFNRENEIDPVLKISNKDWLNLWCGLTGSEYTSFSIQKTFVVDEKEKEVCQDTQQFYFKSEFFALYESHSEPEQGGKAGGEIHLQRPYQRFLDMGFFRGRCRLLLWFFGRNWWKCCNIFTNRAFWGILVLAVLFYWSTISRWVKGDEKKVVSGVGSIKVVKSKSADLKTEKEKELFSQVEKLRNEKAVYLQKYESTKKLLAETSQVVYMSSEKIGFPDGEYVRVGEIIEYGAYKGEQIKEIDLFDDEVRFVSGRVVRLRGLRQFADSLPEEEVPGRLQADFGSSGKPEGNDETESSQD